MITTITLVLVGAVLVVLSYNDRHDLSQVAPRLGIDHFHAYLGVNVCGTWEPAVPQFEGRDGSMNKNPQAGIHSHADYLIHDHPFASDESGKKATLGRYLGYAQTEISSTSLKMWGQWVPNVDKKNGDICSTNKQKAELQWIVGRLGKPWPKQARRGSPADYHIANGDIIAVYFLPKGNKLEQPPGSDAALRNINDLSGASAVSTPSSSVAPAASSSSSPTPSTPPSSADSSTSSTTTAGSSSSSSSP